MSDIAIRVDHLSKLYHIGRAQQRHDTLRDAISDFRLRIADSFRRTNPATRDASSPQSTIRNPKTSGRSRMSPSRSSAGRSSASSVATARGSPPCWRSSPASPSRRAAAS